MRDLRSSLIVPYKDFFADQVVTCGSSSLETSFHRVPRCVYTSAELYEYRGCGGKSANPKHRAFSWGSRHYEVGFISMFTDNQVFVNVISTFSCNAPLD